MVAEPQGDICPGCGGPPMEMAIPHEVMAQRFCDNDECHVFCWDPSMTLTELATDMQVVDLPDISDGQEEIK